MEKKSNLIGVTFENGRKYNWKFKHESINSDNETLSRDIMVDCHSFLKNLSNPQIKATKQNLNWMLHSLKA